MSKLLISLAAFGLAAAMATSASAHPWRHHHHHHHYYHHHYRHHHHRHHHY